MKEAIIILKAIQTNNIPSNQTEHKKSKVSVSKFNHIFIFVTVTNSHKNVNTRRTLCQMDKRKDGRLECLIFDFLNWDLYPFLLMWDVHEDDVNDDDSDDDTETCRGGPSSGFWMGQWIKISRRIYNSFFSGLNLYSNHWHPSSCPWNILGSGKQKRGNFNRRVFATALMMEVEYFSHRKIVNWAKRIK